MMVTPAARAVIRENQLHQLYTIMQLGARDGSVLMDNCLYDLYSKCLITYDAAMSRARNTDRFKPNAD
jgi:twitching motility protein PilT